MLREDLFLLIFLIPLTIGLYLVAKWRNSEANSIQLLIIGTMITVAPILAALTDHNLTPYRFVPFIVFFAVGIGIMFSKKIIHSTQRKYNEM